MKKTQGFVNQYAEEGLRTLFLAQKEVSPGFYKDWKLQADRAKEQVVDRDEEVERVDALIETDLELIGSTAIEDRLQDRVADSIRFMKSTGIKVWVLTGDKIETAMNIGVSAGLLDSAMGQHIAKEAEREPLEKELQVAK